MCGVMALRNRGNERKSERKNENEWSINQSNKHTYKEISSTSECEIQRERIGSICRKIDRRYERMNAWIFEKKTKEVKKKRGEKKGGQTERKKVQDGFVSRYG